MTTDIRGYKTVARNGKWELVERTGDDSDVIHVNDSAPFLLTVEDFAACPFKEVIFGGMDVLAVTLTGSYVTGTGRDGSDYDLAVYVKGSPKPDKPKYKMIFNGRRLHWYYDGACTFGSKEAVDGAYPARFAHLMGLRFLKKEHVLHASDDDMGFVERLLMGCVGLSDAMCELYCAWEKANGRFDCILNSDERQISRMGKLSWLRYFAPAAVLNEDIDADLMRRLKDSKRFGVSADDADRVKETVREYMISYMLRGNACDADSLEESLISRWAGLWKSDC